MALPTLDRPHREAPPAADQAVGTVRVGADDVAVLLRIRRVQPTAWVGALVFEAPGQPPRATGEILRAGSETQLRQAVRDLGAHHLRDLFRSIP